MPTDAQMPWLRKRIWITPDAMCASTGAAGVNTGTIDAGVTQAEISTFGPMGYGMGTNGEIMTGHILIPFDLDPKYEIGFKVVYTADFSGTDSFLWKLQYKVVREGVVYAAPGTSLDTVLVDDSGSVDWSPNVTARGIALPATHAIVRDDVEADTFLMLEVEMDTETGSPTAEAIFLGLIMDYVPWKTTGQGCETDRPLVHTDIV